MPMPVRERMIFEKLSSHSFMEMAGAQLSLFDSKVMQGNWLNSERENLKNAGIISEAEEKLFQNTLEGAIKSSFEDVGECKRTHKGHNGHL